MREKNTTIGILVAIVLIVAVAIGWVSSGYNGLISDREQVDRYYADIGTMLQRRSDLIPNLVQTVSGYMQHEQSIIDSVTASRERMMNTTNAAELAEADQALTQALSNLFVVVENYPELKSNENFIQLQDEISGTENRIAVARRDYNAVVETYNSHIQRFPAVIMARLLGLERVPYFQASNTEVPNVSF